MSDNETTEETTESKIIAFDKLIEDSVDRLGVAKAHFIDGPMNPSNARQPEERLNDDRVFSREGALAPPYSPDLLCKLHEHSNALRQNIDAYSVNIDGNGHRFDPVIDLDSDDATEAVRDAMYLEQLEELSEAGKPHDDLDLPEDPAVEERMKLMKKEMRLEKAKLESFFEFCCDDHSFIKLRMRTREDVEIMGNGYWELLRNASGEPSRFNYVQSFTVRLLPLEKNYIEVERNVKRTPLTYSSMKTHKRFRKYVQVFEGCKVFFKEYGDPRTMSARTGRYYKNESDLQNKETQGEGDVVPVASELIHFEVESPRSPYGIPRWIGSLLAVLGSRQAEEVNFLYFENKSVPPLAVLVSGGRLGQESVNRLKSYVENQIKGRENFHSILVIEAEKAGGSALTEDANGNMKIELVPLTQAQNKDALFQNYDERNIDKVGMTFRLPRMLRGDIRDFNRSCYDERTETLTENGWKRLEQFVDGEKIAAYNRETDKIKFVVPHALHVYEVDEELLHFKSNVADVMVTEDHKMLVCGEDNYRRHGGEFEVVLSQDIEKKWQRYRFKSSGSGCEGGEEILSFTLPKDPGCQIERGHDHTTSIDGDAFLEFLGYWLSEGSLLSTKHSSAPYIVTLSQNGGLKADKMRECLDRLGWVYSESVEQSGFVRWCISNRCLSTWLRDYCGANSKEKRIPFTNLCERQTRILFDALMMGDGNWDTREGRTNGYYSSTSRTLADDVQSIAVRLGYRASIALHYTGESRGERCHDCYRVLISEKVNTRFNNLPERVAYQGRVYCFSVPTHGFFVTRRNGKVSIQGNTAEAALEFAETQIFSPERSDFDWQINRTIMTELGIKFWRFASNSPTSSNPIDLTEMIERMITVSVLTPEEGRELLKAVFNRDFKKIDEVWTKIPPELLKAGFLPSGEDFDMPFSVPADATDPNGDEQSGEEEEEEEEIEQADLSTGNLQTQGGAKVPAQGGKKKKPRSKTKGFTRLPATSQAKRLRKLAHDLIALQKALREEESRYETEKFKSERIDEMKREVITIPQAEFDSLING